MSEYEWFLEGHERFLRDMDVLALTAQRLLKEEIDELGKFAHRSMLLYTVGRERLQARIGITGVYRIAPSYWEQVAGAKGPHPFPFYVHGGTGVRGPYRRPYGALADRAPATVISTRRPRLTKAQGGVLRWQDSSGKVFYRRQVAGQRPNPFVERAYRDAQVYASGRVQRLGQRLVRSV